MKRLWRFWIVLILLASAWQPAPPASAQETEWAAEAQALLENMTVAERVGQLFLVTFTGNEVTAGSDIADLVLNYQVGGVMLLAENDNITSQENAPLQVAELTNALQRLALLGSEALDEPVEEGEDGILSANFPTPTPIGIPVPLFIATVHEGDGAPFTQILNGLTEVPNQMAIGATWQPDNSRVVGEIVGRELSATGINLLLGPSLDVLENLGPSSQGDLGTRTFGGDPFWVGLMGQAYTAGVHTGSNSRIAVIAKHFPGYGSSDRPLNEEVSTVRKSLEQLKQIELAPFFAVTGNAVTGGASTTEATIDGLLTSHVRYQGFQGNIRATTLPVSFDPQALSTLMQLSEMAGWRASGGLLVSDSLGARAVERFYDDTEQEFPHRRVAKDALFAGNDLLYLSDFALGRAPYSVQLANIRDTITWFREKYETDQTFQQRVDDAVRRILQLKLRLYGGNFNPGQVLVDAAALPAVLNQGQAAMFDLAQSAVTLISPNPTDLIEQLPPGLNDNIVVFTDERQTQQCSSCPAHPMLGQKDLEERMLALYGPAATGQVQPGQIRSFTFAELKEFLAISPEAIPAPTPTVTPTATPAEGEAPAPENPPAALTPTPTLPVPLQVQAALQNADWVIFALLRPTPEAAASDALHLFLAQRPDIIRNTRVIVFAYNAPYYLDTTEISRLTAYFGVYSKIDSFVDASVRALFQESPLRGRPPVDVEGIGYELFKVTQPNPNQVIELYIVDRGQPQSPPSEQPLEVVPGATLRLQTGIIRDHNGNPVPDGTPVQFVQVDRIQGFENVIAERPTVGGIANLDYLLQARAGNFRITAVAGEASASQEVDIVIGENAIVSINTPVSPPTVPPSPTIRPSGTPTSTGTPTPTATPRPRPTATLTPFPPDEKPPLENFLASVGMLLSIGLGLALIGSTGYLLGRNGQNNMSQIVRSILWGVVGSLILYNYFALGLPGAAALEQLGGWAGLLTTLAGGVIGLVLYHWRVATKDQRLEIGD
ncbi:MAG: hypothetical protein L0332_10365 [Chloroflexi bacterium]|nr:hypothetical protein [Chloroflexota bacterium]MCI0647858.1 hypothetical protein [Chloroflexota bacterium]MCI0727109.1 hypothetical protein [Chloroflexota bacterium]